MSRSTITVSPRTGSGKGASRRLRATGSVPGVVYSKGKDPVAVAADPKVVAAILNGPRGRNTPLDVQVTGESGTRLAIIKDYQVHPWKRRLTHVDFWEVDADRTLTITVPFKKTGKSAAERAGATSAITRHYIKVACTPDKTPSHIEYDMSELPDVPAVNISEVPMPEGVEAVYKHDYGIIQLKAAKVVEADAEDGEES